jgi:hypothetical protein
MRDHGSSRLQNPIVRLAALDQGAILGHVLLVREGRDAADGLGNETGGVVLANRDTFHQLPIQPDQFGILVCVVVTLLERIFARPVARCGQHSREDRTARQSAGQDDDVVWASWRRSRLATFLAVTP